MDLVRRIVWKLEYNDLITFGKKEWQDILPLNSNRGSRKRVRSIRYGSDSPFAARP